jgi:hypothetical protein
VGGELEGTWLAVGDRLFTALDGLRPAPGRYRALDVGRFGRTWRITADRLTAEDLREQGAELHEARQAIRASLAA